MCVSSSFTNDVLLQLIIFSVFLERLHIQESENQLASLRQAAHQSVTSISYLLSHYALMHCTRVLNLRFLLRGDEQVE